MFPPAWLVTHVYYPFAADDTANGTYTIITTDRATNQTTVPFTVTRDAVPPTVALTLPERIAAGDIPVQWSSVEDGSGLRGLSIIARKCTTSFRQ